MPVCDEPNGSDQDSDDEGKDKKLHSPEANPQGGHATT